MLGELRRVPLVRTGVQPADEPLDHAAGDQREVLYPGQSLGIEEAVTGLIGHGGTASALYRNWCFLRKCHSKVKTATRTAQQAGGQ